METERMSRKAFDSLLTYSTSLPTGTPIGKTWKRRVPYREALDDGRPPDWYIGEYVDHKDPGKVGIEWRKIEVEEPAK